MANYVKFMRGTPAAYKACDKNSDTLYFIAEKDASTGILYLGETMIAGSTGEEVIHLSQIEDILIRDGFNVEGLLVYDPETEKWVSTSFAELVFIGATAGSDGKAGLVPKPLAGQNHLFLRGDGNWAAAGSTIQAYEVIVEGEETHDEAIARVTKDITINNGDVTIVKVLISEDNYHNTAYIYDDGKWVALDGNYSAENVYFKNDFIFTESIGTVTIPSTGSVSVPAAGKNLKEFLASLFSEESEPTTNPPTAKLTASKCIAYEVGTKVSPNYTAGLDSVGSYTYGPETGVVATGYEVSATGEETKLTTASGTFPEITVTDTTEYYITAKVSHSAGAVPVTNIGNPYPDGQIAAGSVSKSSSKLYGYRAFFYGMVANDNAIDSALIRGLTNGGNYNAKKELTFTAANLEGVKKFIIAVPASNTRKGLTSATITSSMNADATSDYVLMDTQVSVEGKDGHDAVPYKVWVYAPASIASTEVHKVVLS